MTLSVAADVIFEPWHRAADQMPEPSWHLRTDQLAELRETGRVLSLDEAIILTRERWYKARTDDWLEGFAALADDPPFLAVLNGVVVATVQACAEAGIQPPFHVLLAAVVLAAVLDVRATTRRLRR
jgi:hypothetical protein